MEVDLINNCSPIKAHFGDHQPVMVELSLTTPAPKSSIQRDWWLLPLSCSNYFADVNFKIGSAYIQQFLNKLENKTIHEVNSLVPLSEFQY
jgi:hypothetical protein